MRSIKEKSAKWNWLRWVLHGFPPLGSHFCHPIINNPKKVFFFKNPYSPHMLKRIIPSTSLIASSPSSFLHFHPHIPSLRSTFTKQISIYTPYHLSSTYSSRHTMSTATQTDPSSNPQAAGVIYVQGVPTKETRLTLGGAISVSPMAIGTWAWGVSCRSFLIFLLHNHVVIGRAPI